MVEELDRSFPLSKLFPNMVTIMGLCFGLFGLKYAIVGKWEVAVGFIVIAAFVDGMDGRIARLLNASSPMGAQLDSLADFCNFAIAPALTLYMWKMHEIKGIGWAVALLFIICGALRLARFNVSLSDNSELGQKRRDRFFQGIPAPCGAGLSLVPMMIVFFMNEKLPEPWFEMSPWVVIVTTALIALLLISNMPTISIKKMNIRRELASLAMVLIALFVVALIIEPWITLPLMGLIYILLIPLGVLQHYRMK